MTLIIITAVVIGLGLYMVPNETKGALKWGWTGARGVANDAKAIRHASIERQVLNPQVVADTVKYLDGMVVDTTTYHKQASKREQLARTSLNSKLEALVENI